MCVRKREQCVCVCAQREDILAVSLGDVSLIL